ncbi:MAG: transcriptional regulator [Ketobacter sp.]
MADKMQSESTAQDSTQRMRRVSNTMEAGALIKESRKKQSIRQDDIGEMIGASHLYVRNVETGKPTANWGGVFALCEELGIEIYFRLPKDRMNTDD